MPHKASQPARRRLLPRPAALSVTDDVGGIHRYHAPPDWLPWTTREPDAVSREVRREQMQAGWHLSMNLIMAAIFLAYIMVATTKGMSSHFMFAGAFAICFGGGWIAMWVAHRRLEANWGSLGRQWADAGLGRGRCPICLYSLAGAEAGESGLARCAECGAAWDAERIWPESEPDQPHWQHWLGLMVGDGLRRRMLDDTGRPFSGERLRSIAARASRAHPHVAQAALQVASTGSMLRIMLAAVVAAPFLVLVAALLTGQGALSGRLMLAMVFVLPPILLVGLIGRSELGLTANARRRGMLAAGLCPVCGGDLAGEVPDDRGLISCSDCDARWRRQQ